VAEILATENFEINVFGSNEEPRSSGQVSALSLFQHSALFDFDLSYPIFGGINSNRS